jgi:hypothetical protein
MTERLTYSVLKVVLEMARSHADNGRDGDQLRKDIHALCDLLEAERARVRELEAGLEWLTLCPCPNDDLDCELNGGVKSCGECMSDHARALLKGGEDE